jgi:hypothetical protein
MTAAETAMHHIATRMGYAYTAGHEPSFWLRSRLIDLSCQRRRGCRHLAGPQFAALWDPGVVVCLLCAMTLRADGDEDLTCDRCRQLQHPTITVCAVVWDDTLVTFGLCDDCAAREYAGGMS